MSLLFSVQVEATINLLCAVYQFNLLKVKSSMDVENADHYNKNLLECMGLHCN